MRKEIRDYLKSQLSDRPFYYNKNVIGKMFNNISLCYTYTPQYQLETRISPYKAMGITPIRKRGMLFSVELIGSLIKKYKKKYKYESNLNHCTKADIDKMIAFAMKIDAEISNIIKKKEQRKKLKDIDSDFS